MINFLTRIQCFTLIILGICIFCFLIHQFSLSSVLFSHCFLSPVFLYVVSGLSFPLRTMLGPDRDGPVMPCFLLFLFLLRQNNLVMLTQPTYNIVTLKIDTPTGLSIPCLRMRSCNKKMIYLCRGDNVYVSANLFLP